MLVLTSEQGRRAGAGVFGFDIPYLLQMRTFPHVRIFVLNAEMFLVFGEIQMTKEALFKMPYFQT